MKRVREIRAEVLEARRALTFVPFAELGMPSPEPVPALSYFESIWPRLAPRDEPLTQEILRALDRGLEHATGHRRDQLREAKRQFQGLLRKETDEMVSDRRERYHAQRIALEQDLTRWLTKTGHLHICRH